MPSGTAPDPSTFRKPPPSTGATAKPQTHRWRRLIVLALVLLVPYQLRVAGVARIVSATPTEALSPVDGVVASITAKEGQAVKAGAVLASVTPDGGRPPLSVSSPSEGVVQTPDHELQSRIGTRVKTGDALCSIVDPQKLLVEVEVLQRELSDVAVGAGAAVKLYGYPGDTLHGRVSHIDDQAHMKDGDAVVAVTVTLDEPAAYVRLGMQGWAKIDSGKLQVIGTLMARRFARSLWVELWSLF